MSNIIYVISKVERNGSFSKSYVHHFFCHPSRGKAILVLSNLSEFDWCIADQDLNSDLNSDLDSQGIDDLIIALLLTESKKEKSE